jgi:hypothetical protein
MRRLKMTKKDYSAYIRVGSKRPAQQKLCRAIEPISIEYPPAAALPNSTNPQRGSDFEAEVQRWLAWQGVHVAPCFSIPVGAASAQRSHRFDLGSSQPPVLVECKCHTWTVTGNAPSAKLTVWNEAMHYFACAPREYRKLLVVAQSVRNGVTLAEHYVKRYGHLVPAGVELWEIDPMAKHAVQRFVGK